MDLVFSPPFEKGVPAKERGILSKLSPISLLFNFLLLRYLHHCPSKELSLNILHFLLLIKFCYILIPFSHSTFSIFIGRFWILKTGVVSPRRAFPLPVVARGYFA